MAAAMLGMSISRTIIQEFDQFKTLIFDGGRTSQLLRRLCASLKMLEDHDGLLRLDLPYLQIDDLIYRYLALLLLPQGVLLPPAPSSPGEHRDRIFEDLLEWIRANLGASLNLTELEHRSGYSRRTLQNTFRFRFGCGPIQWVRRQRLEQARLVLLDPPQPYDTVTSIARRFGFNSLMVFSRDVIQAFGSHPSECMRLGRNRVL